MAGARWRWGARCGSPPWRFNDLMEMREMADDTRQQMNWSRMITIFVFVLALFILFDPSLREGLGTLVGYGLEPVVGFGGGYPVVSLFLTGMIMVTVSILLRHFFTDFVEQMKNQKIMAAFNKELRQARTDNNTYKIKKLTEQQQQIMQKSMKVTMDQIKFLPIIMVVVIPIFAWLAVFMGAMDNTMVAVPWSHNASLLDTYLLPAWILLYSLIALPFGQILYRVLRLFSFKKRLQEMEAEAQSG